MKWTIPTELYINPSAEKCTFILSQAKNRTVQLSGTVAERRAGGKTDLPLINFRSRERHQQDLVPLSYHRQGLQRRKKGGGGKREKNT